MKAVESLVRYGVNINHHDQGGSTSLHWSVENAAVNKQGMEILSFLVQSGANIDDVDKQGRTAFDRVCTSSGNLNAAQILLNAGCRIIKDVSSIQPMTNLMMAAMNGHKELCKLLVSTYKCNPDVKTGHGHDSIQFAKNGGHVGIVHAYLGVLEVFEQWRKTGA